MNRVTGLRKILRTHEKKLIREALNQCNWKVPKAAKILDTGLSTLYRRIAELGIGLRKKGGNQGKEIT